MEEHWKGALKEANKLYDSGDYPAAFRFADEAVEFLAKDFALTLRKRMWAARFTGYKDETVRAEMYETTRSDAKLILAISKDLEMRNSAIKLLMLLPGENVAELCKKGIAELESAQFFEEGLRQDLLADLKNSLGLEVRKTDPKAALKIFEEAYKTVRHRTVIAGHLMQNAGSCWLILKDRTDVEELKSLYAVTAIAFLEKALQEYPADKTEHRRSVQNKINNTKEELKNWK